MVRFLLYLVFLACNLGFRYAILLPDVAERDKIEVSVHRVAGLTVEGVVAFGADIRSSHGLKADDLRSTVFAFHDLVLLPVPDVPFIAILIRRGIMDYSVKFTWDNDAGVWYATSDDIPGLVLESESFDTLVNRVRVAAPEILELNCPGAFIDSITILAKRQEVVSH